MDHRWGMQEKLTLTGVGDVLRALIRLPHSHSCTWSKECQAKIVLHRWNEGSKLFVIKTRWLLGRRGAWFMRAAQITQITRARCFTQTGTQKRVQHLTISIKMVNEKCTISICQAYFWRLKIFYPFWLTAGAIRRSLWMSGSAKWISLMLMKTSSQICWGAALLFTPFLPDTYAGVLQGLLRWEG